MSIPGNPVSASASTHSFVVQLAKTRSNFKMQTTVVLMLHSEGTLWQRFLVHLLSWMKFEDILKTLPTSNLNLKALQETTKRHETFRIVLSKEVARGGAAALPDFGKLYGKVWPVSILYLPPSIPKVAPPTFVLYKCK